MWTCQTAASESLIYKNNVKTLYTNQFHVVSMNVINRK